MWDSDDKEWNLFISGFIWPAGPQYHPAYQEQYFVLYGKTPGAGVQSLSRLTGLSKSSAGGERDRLDSVWKPTCPHGKVLENSRATPRAGWNQAVPPAIGILFCKIL